MEAWARRYRDRAQFLCVCVESRQVAVAFSRMFDLRAAVNGYVPGRSYMPVGYGQLGCSGFIVSDSKGCFVSRKTRAYLDYGEDAFSQVEEILARELGVRPPPPPSPAKNGVLHPSYPYKVGSRAVLDGISNQPSLNGTRVVIIGFDSTSQRFHVKLDDGSERLLAVLPCSIAPGPKQPPPKEEKKSEDPLESIEVPASVGNDGMDDEHKRCTDALNLLLLEPSLLHLRLAIDILAEHFEHEEQLLKKHGFGGDPSSSFSALASHTKDHNRILDLGRKVLKKQQPADECKDEAISC